MTKPEQFRPLGSRLRSTQAAQTHSDPTLTVKNHPGGTSVVRILLSDQEAADLYGVGLRTFLKLIDQPWFPPPLVLGKRLRRHSLRALEEAADRMPTAPRQAEPAQLLKGKLERLKRQAGSVGA